MPSGHWCPVEVFLDKEATTSNSISTVEEHLEAFFQKNLLKTGTELRHTLQHLTLLPCCPNFGEQGNINFTGQELCYILCYQPTT